MRHDIGRWAFVAARAGMKGFLRNGYMYVCSKPYFDFSDDEASWSVVYPSRHGLSDTVGWERTAQGVNDYRYLLTCERLIRQARRRARVRPMRPRASQGNATAHRHRRQGNGPALAPQYDDSAPPWPGTSRI